MRNMINDNLTKHEFQRLANRQPDFDGKWVQRPADGREHGSGPVWLFGKDNELLDYTVTHDNSGDLRDCFFGRSENRQRFQSGDIVEIVSEGESVLAVLACIAPDIEWLLAKT